MDSLWENVKREVEKAGEKTERDQTKQREVESEFTGILNHLAVTLTPSSLVCELEEYKISAPVIRFYKSEDLKLYKATCQNNDGLRNAISASKELSKEMACYEFLKLVRERYPDYNIPNIEVPESIMVDPSIINQLEAEFTDVECNFKMGINSNGFIEFNSEIRCKDKFGVERMANATGAEQKYVKLEAAIRLWRQLKPTENLPVLKSFVGEELNRFNQMSALNNWTPVEGMQVEDELDMLVQEHEKEKTKDMKRKHQSKLQESTKSKRSKSDSEDTDDELDKLISFSKQFKK